MKKNGILTLLFACTMLIALKVMMWSLELVQLVQGRPF